SRLGSCKTPLGCSISQFFTFARKYSSQSWEPYDVLGTVNALSARCTRLAGKMNGAVRALSAGTDRNLLR
ncbi:MAG: hypothetical protein KHX26_11080, partial [Burkholderiales bacterium]|nr:hypothetical protein [Burkholderiales bacterium]